MRFATIVGTLALTALTALPAVAEDLKIHGSTTVVANIFAPFTSDIEAETGHNLTVVGNGSTRGILDVASGAADLGMISAPLDATVAKAEAKDETFDPDGLQAHQVGETRVAFIRNPSNSVSELTMTQLSAVLSGEITNWSELGGKSAPIVVVVEKQGGLRSMAEKALLGGNGISAKTKSVAIATQVPKVVAQLPSAIGIAAASLVTAKTPEVNTDEAISQPLILVTKGAPNEAQRSVIDAASAVGG